MALTAGHFYILQPSPGSFLTDAIWLCIEVAALGQACTMVNILAANANLGHTQTDSDTFWAEVVPLGTLTFGGKTLSTDDLVEQGNVRAVVRSIWVTPPVGPPAEAIVGMVPISAGGSSERIVLMEFTLVTKVGTYPLPTPP